MLIRNETSETKTFKIGNKFYTFLKGEAKEVNDDAINQCPEIKKIMTGRSESIVKTKKGDANVDKVKKRQS
jgi:hypothetical protein